MYFGGKGPAIPNILPYTKENPYGLWYIPSAIAVKAHLKYRSGAIDQDDDGEHHHHELELP